MKKSLVMVLIAGMLVSNVAVQAANQIDKGYISVNSSANTEMAPDVAEISFEVQTFDAKSMQKATAMNKEISDKVLADLSLMLNLTNGDYIKTADYSAQPIYKYDGSKRSFDKYEVSNRVIVHTKSLDKVGNMIDKAIAAGATNVANLNFSVSTYENQCNDLIVVATKKAQTRANLVARTMGSNLDGIRTFDTSCSAANNYTLPRMYKAQNMLFSSAEGAAADSSATSISAGVIKINANVNASFFVK